jgi:hypothetical protein
MKTLLILALGLVCSLPARADILPDKPEPQVRHNPITYPLRATGDTFKDVFTFKDKQFSAVALAYIGAYGADMVSTKEMFDKFPPTPGRRASVEGGPFFHGTRDAGRIAAAWGGVTIANIVIAHEWKKHVKNRFLRDLWSTGMVYQSAEHIDAVVRNSRLGEKQ